MNSIFSTEKLRRTWDASIQTTDSPTTTTEEAPPETLRQILAVFDQVKASAMVRYPKESHAILRSLLDDLDSDIRSFFGKSVFSQPDLDPAGIKWFLIRKIEQIEELIDAFDMIPMKR